MSVESASSVPFATASFISPQAQYRIEKENDDHAEDRKTEFSRTNEDFAEKPVNDYLNIRIDEFPERMQPNIKRLIEEKLKLQKEAAASKVKIHMLRDELKSNIKNIKRVRDLNIKLQITFYAKCEAAARIAASNGTKMTARKLTDLECCEIGEKGDAKFIIKLLLTLYGSDKLRIMSVTGRPSRNKTYVQEKSERISPENLQFIKEKFYERVQNEHISSFQVENRCRDVRVHKIINKKIQNLKRCVCRKDRLKAKSSRN